MDKASGIALQSLSRFLFAACLTALSNAVILTIIAAAGRSGPPNLPLYFWLALLQSFVVIGAFALLLGVPITTALARSGAEGAIVYFVVGGVAGAAMYELMHILLSSGIPLSRHLEPQALLSSAANGGVPGGLFGLFWWLVGRKPMLKKESNG